MTTAAEKTTRNATVQRQPNTAVNIFFRKAGEETFFGPTVDRAFFSTPVQAKLSVSHPEDPQEKEADQVSEQVMRREETADASGINRKDNEDLHRIHRKHVRQIQRKEKGEEELPAPESNIQTGGGFTIYRKRLGMHHSDVIQRSGRGPPAGPTTTFEESLSATKGGGTPLPEETRGFMESRFGADFCGVRIHTGTHAENLNRSIHAQAFTHGNDIYFNSGKYSPETEDGKSLLAHELTHTIQQGASPGKSNVSPKHIVSNIVSPKEKIQRNAERGAVPAQLDSAVKHAKSKEGQVNAGKESPDGYRIGSQHLVDFFKSAMGEDKVVSGGAGTAVKGAVSEQDIRKRRTTEGAVADKDHPGTAHSGTRDAMPSWCGIFVFWALNKGGVPMPKWQLGGRSVDLKAVYPPGYVPHAGDIAYRAALSHYAIVEKASGPTVTTVNGNTAGEDNLGGQIQARDHPLRDWTGFFNPLKMMQGSLRSGDTGGEEQVRSLKELRKKLFNVQRKSENAELPADENEEKTVQRSEEKTPETLKGLDHQENASHTLPVINNSVPEIQKKEENPDKEEEKTLHKTAETGEKEADENKPRAPPEVSIHPTLNGKVIQRSWLGDAWNAVTGFVSEAAQWVERGLDAAKEWLLRKVRDFVRAIPGYSMLSLILGEDPITGEVVPFTPQNLLNAAIDILPGGFMFRSLFNRLGIFNDVALYLAGRIQDLASLAAGIANRFIRFWDQLTLSDVGDPQGVMNRVAELFRSSITDITGFISRSASEFLRMIKEVMIREISSFVRGRIPRLYPLLTVALGFDPETQQPVARNGTNILNAFLEMSEDGREQRRQMMETGTFQRIAGWVDRGIAVFTRAYMLLRQAIAGIWNFVTIENLFHPIETFTRIWDQFSEPVRIVGRFIIDAALEILRVIKEALMRRLSEFARNTRGYPLICVIIGKDPFTNVAVPRTVHNIVRGFMSLMDGGEQQYEQLRESGAIDRIVNKILAAVARLNMTPQSIVQLFIALWNSFSIRDLAHPIEAFRRIVATFVRPILRLIAFIIEILMIVIEAILILMSFPFNLIANIIAKARQAWQAIKNDPAGFLKNLLRAIKQGFIQFFENIAVHLISGLVGWLMRELRDANVPAPADFSLRGIISWVLQVLNLSMETIWQKLAEHPQIGPERVARIRSMINTLEGIWTFIRDVQERGVSAIWDRIKEQLSNLWNTVLDAIKNWIMEQIIGKIVTKLLSMLDPTGIMAVVNSVIALYRAVQSFIRYVREMLEIVNSFVEGIAEIASGNVRRAADFLERTLARGIPIVIGFLANQLGLSGIGRRIAEMIGTARQLVDRALTWLVNKAVELGGRLLQMGRAAVTRIRDWLGLNHRFSVDSEESHTLRLRKTGSSAELIIQSQTASIMAFLDAYALKKPNKKAEVDAIKNYIKKDIDKKIEKIDKETDENQKSVLAAELLDKMIELSEKLRVLLGDATLPVSLTEKYGLEGLSGTYASMPKPVGDDFTADHIPQNALFIEAREWRNPEDNTKLFPAGTPMATHAANRTALGIAMNEHKLRHMDGRTYGSKGNETKQKFVEKLDNDLPKIKNTQNRKNKVIEIIRGDMDKDVTAMQAVYNKKLTSPVWDDINSRNDLTAKEKKKIREKIVDQANNGLSLVKSQNLDNLKN